MRTGKKTLKEKMIYKEDEAVAKVVEKQLS
jgi:hypothetical protein